MNLHYYTPDEGYIYTASEACLFQSENKNTRIFILVKKITTIYEQKVNCKNQIFFNKYNNFCVRQICRIAVYSVKLQNNKFV